MFRRRLKGSIGQDLRLASRLLLKDRWFTVTAATALAVGIGMNGTMFTIVHAMTRGLPNDSARRIMSVHTRDGAGRWRGLGVSYLDFREFHASSHAFSGLSAYSPGTITIGDDGRPPERGAACYVAANAFRLLDVRPIIGRDFADGDDRPGAPPVVILGSTFWKAMYSGRYRLAAGGGGDGSVPDSCPPGHARRPVDRAPVRMSATADRPNCRE